MGPHAPFACKFKSKNRKNDGCSPAFKDLSSGLFSGLPNFVGEKNRGPHPSLPFYNPEKAAFMKILFLSDIHGSLPALEAVLSFYDAHHYELLVLLGDLLNYGPRNGVCQGLDAMAVAERLNQRAEHIICVRGNCDSEVDQMLLVFPIESTYTMVVDEGRKFFITHGHIFNEKHLPLGPSCDVFVYGHTHLMSLQKADPQKGRPAILNTGSPTFPKNGNPATFATYEDGCLSLRTLDGKAIEELRL